jgi:hypothetical protein
MSMAHCEENSRFNWAKPMRDYHPELSEGNLKNAERAS